MSKKPLGIRAYGSIGHLPNSRLGSGDHSVNDGQARICTVAKRDAQDRIIVLEKLDGSCVAVAKIGGQIVPLVRAGYTAESSPHENHHLFAEWVRRNRLRFVDVLREGERIVGERLAMVVGTRYDLGDSDPFKAFDLMQGHDRAPFDALRERIDGHFSSPHVISDGPALATDAAMHLHRHACWPCDEIEGVVYRVERAGCVEFLAKYVRHDKVDGKHLPSVSGREPLWNWRPNWWNGGAK